MLDADAAAVYRRGIGRVLVRPTACVFVVAIDQCGFTGFVLRDERCESYSSSFRLSFHVLCAVMAQGHSLFPARYVVDRLTAAAFRQCGKSVVALLR